MKSKFTKYQRMATLPLKNVEEQLNLDDKGFYNLLKIWLNQGLISENNYHYKQLEHLDQRKQNEIKKQKNEKDYSMYKYLRKMGDSIEQISLELDRDIDKIERYDKRWYHELLKQNMSLSDICQETNIPLKTLLELEESEKQKKEEHERLVKKILNSNVKYARKYIDKIKADPSKFVIFDLEGVQQPDEILEISAINLKGDVLMNTLVRPTHHIGYYVTKLTGITDRLARTGIGLYKALKEFKQIAQDKYLIGWGITYDKILLNQAMRRTRIYIDCKFVDMQKIHAGLINTSQQIALYKAAGLESQAHRSLDDCKMLLKVLKEDIHLEDEEEDKDE